MCDVLSIAQNCTKPTSRHYDVICRLLAILRQTCNNTEIMCSVIVLSIEKPMLFVYENPVAISQRKSYLVRNIRTEN
jgi:hypothetical protein